MSDPTPARGRHPGATPTPTAAAADTAPPHTARKPHRLARAFSVICWIYLITVLLAWLTLRLTGDRWWAATLLLFGPRWLCALPLLLLIPAALVFRRRSLAPLLCAAAVVAFGMMDLCLPWRPLFHRAAANDFRLRLLTCNVHRGQLRPGLLGELIAKEHPDVVALQEWSSAHEWQVFAGDPQWHVLRDDELYIASRYPILRVQNIAKDKWTGPGSAVCYEIDTPAGPVPFVNLHLASPHMAFEDAIDRENGAGDRVQANSDTRLQQLRDLNQAAQAFGPSVLLAGDFNTPTDSAVYRQTITSLDDAFAQAGAGFGWTYYAHFTAARIDHLLSGQNWRCQRAWVGPNCGSPHRPLMADYVSIHHGG